MLFHCVIKIILKYISIGQQVSRGTTTDLEHLTNLSRIESRKTIVGMSPGLVETT